MKKLSLYVHIPFCVSKCAYCAFLSFSGKQNCFDLYVSKLIEQIKTFGSKLENHVVSTIFVGGGTPSVLKAGDVPKILNAIKQNFVVQKNVEITVEANPESFDFEKAQCWKTAGVNRISFGLQTDDDNMLKKLGRPHTRQMFARAVETAKKVGLKNINADILLGLEGQTTKSLKKTFEFLFGQNLQHISAYGLMVEEGTPLFDWVKQKKYQLPTEDESVLLYEFAKKELEKNGFLRYEISNFAKKGFECKHNKNYWSRGEFVGFGLGAFSFFDGEHSQNTENLEQFLKNPNSKKSVEKQTKTTAQNETVMLALRTETGLDLKKFQKNFGHDFLETFEEQIKNLLQANLIEIDGGFLKIKDFQVSNFVIEQFFV